MIAESSSAECPCVLVDLNTQYDFFHAQGAMPVLEAPYLIPAIRTVVAWGRRNRVPVISSVESRRPEEALGSTQQRCCVDGSAGQRKLEFTIFPSSTYVEVDNTLTVPTDLFNQYQQVVFRKRSDDLLTNPKADRFLTQLAINEFILFGAGIERCVKSLALALLARHKTVKIITDACGCWNRSVADLSLRQVVAKGAELLTVDELRAMRPPRVSGRMWGGVRVHAGQRRGASRSAIRSQVARRPTIKSDLPTA